MPKPSIISKHQEIRNLGEAFNQKFDHIKLGLQPTINTETISTSLDLQNLKSVLS